MNSDNELAQVTKSDLRGLEIAAVAEEEAVSLPFLTTHFAGRLSTFFQEQFCLLPGGSSMTIFWPSQRLITYHALPASRRHASRGHCGVLHF